MSGRRELRFPISLEIHNFSVDAPLDQLPIIPIGRNELQLAATLDGNDFEDNLQLACALHMQLDVIVTRNFSGFNHDSISILSPQEMLLRLSQEQ